WAGTVDADTLGTEAMPGVASLPRPAHPVLVPPVPAAPGIPAHAAASELPAEAMGRVAVLQSSLAADPADLASRKELSLILLNSGQLVEAFEEAKAVLAAQPDDPDGLYVQAVVRLAMGQSTTCLKLLDRVLERYPDHVLAQMTRGKALLKLGNRELAVDTWTEALKDAGGKHPGLERLLAEQGEGPADLSALRRILASPEKLAPPAAPPVPGNVFRIRVEAPAGGAAPPTGTLFAALRSSAGGPPAAVKKVPRPTFPLVITLGPEDSMMGQELPDDGTLSVRLDGDGNVTTTGATDLAATARAAAGTTTVLVLGS
ncbi:MAG: tetratricopeptide repeat protein, partial [Acidobacteria bacterium]|nr:tetratricopeptide repeat protein [Acidobacteriota bacterium]